MLDKLIELDDKIHNLIESIFKLIFILAAFSYIDCMFFVKDKILTKDFARAVKKPLKFAIVLTVCQNFPSILLLFNEVGIIVSLFSVLISFVFWYTVIGIVWFGFGSQLFISRKFKESLKMYYEKAKSAFNKKSTVNNENIENNNAYIHDYDFSKIFDSYRE